MNYFCLPPSLARPMDMHSVSAKSQVKIKDAFDLLVRRVLARNSKGSFGASDGAVGTLTALS